MTGFPALDKRPLIVAIAGPNGAGKSTFYHAHIASAGLRYVNADVLAAELKIHPYNAAQMADALRRALVSRGESFAFETVLSDPVAEKIAFLEDAASRGYTVVFCFIGLTSASESMERVAMRVSQGGHDVPDEKICARFPRTLANLRAAIARLPHVIIYDNSNLSTPYRQVLVFERGVTGAKQEPVPDWLQDVLP